MAPPYMTVNEFGAYMMLFVFAFGVAAFTVVLIVESEIVDIAFIGLYVVLIFSLVLSIIMVLVQEFK